MWGRKEQEEYKPLSSEDEQAASDAEQSLGALRAEVPPFVSSEVLADQSESTDAAFQGLKKGEEAIADQSRFLTSIGERFKDSRALKTVQALAFAFSLSTGIVERAHAEVLTTPPAKTWEESAERREQRQAEARKEMRRVFRAEVARYKGITGEAALAREILPDIQNDKGGIYSTLEMLVREEMPKALQNPEQCGENTLQHAMESQRTACDLAVHHGQELRGTTFPVVLEANPLRHLEEKNFSRIAIADELQPPDARTKPVEILPFTVQSSRDEEQKQIEVRLTNWLAEKDESVRITVPDTREGKLQAAAQILKTYAEERRAFREALQNVTPEKRTVMRPVIRPLPEKQITQEQRRIIDEIFQKADSIEIQIYPKSRMGAAELYARGTAKVAIDKNFFMRNGYPVLAVDSQVPNIFIRMKKEFFKHGGKLHMSSVQDAYHNLVQYVVFGGEETLVIKPPFAFCEVDTGCDDLRDMAADLSLSGFGVLQGIFFQDKESPGGHAQDDEAEFLASLINSLFHSRWEDKIISMSKEFVADYRDSLVVVQQILDDRVAHAQELSPDAPIRAKIRDRIAFIDQKT